MYICVCVYIYVYIYKLYTYIYGIHFELRFLRFHVESWSKWDLNPQPCAFCAHALTTEVSG